MWSNERMNSLLLSSPAAFQVRAQEGLGYIPRLRITIPIRVTVNISPVRESLL